MRDLNVLVFPSGTEIGQEIWKALRYVKNVNLIGASSLKADPTLLTYKTAWPIEGTAHNVKSGWNHSVNEAIKELEIDYVFPAHDAVLEYSEHISGAPVLTSSPETCKTCRSKKQTYNLVSEFIKTPEIYCEWPAVGMRSEFPAFKKPDKGQGSQGTDVVYSKEAWDATARAGDLLLEYLPGDEYTVECFTSRKGGLIHVGARKRITTKAGICIFGEYTDDRPETRTIAAHLNHIFKFRGPWFFQVKEDKGGELVLLEVAPRIPGTAALSRINGVNLPLLTLHEWEGDGITVSFQLNSQIISRTLTERYALKFDFTEVFVDLEDTLIVKGELNLLLVRFLFQCVERKIPIYLLTRYQKPDLPIKLREHRVYQLFDEIFVVPDEREKGEYIQDTGAIFIDDSYSERMKVSHNKGVACFDLSQIEVLLDDCL